MERPQINLLKVLHCSTQMCKALTPWLNLCKLLSKLRVTPSLTLLRHNSCPSEHSHCEYKSNSPSLLGSGGKMFYIYKSCFILQMLLLVNQPTLNVCVWGAPTKCCGIHPGGDQQALSETPSLHHCKDLNDSLSCFMESVDLLHGLPVKNTAPSALCCMSLSSICWPHTGLSWTQRPWLWHLL